MILIGHRGAAGYEIENTLKSFKKAIDLKVDMIELDVRRCASGELVVVHDAKINRVALGRGVIKKLSLEKLKKIPLLDGQEICTLDEALRFIGNQVGVNIDLKEKDLAEEVVGLLQKLFYAGICNKEKIIISSFHHKELEEIKNLDKDLKVGLLYHRHIRDIVKKAKKIGAFSVHPHFKYIKKKTIEELKANGIQVNIWVVNGAVDIRKTLNLKPDGIISDYPDLIKSQL